MNQSPQDPKFRTEDHMTNSGRYENVDGTRMDTVPEEEEVHLETDHKNDQKEDAIDLDSLIARSMNSHSRNASMNQDSRDGNDHFGTFKDYDMPQMDYDTRVRLSETKTSQGEMSRSETLGLDSPHGKGKGKGEGVTL
jgi:hypothetical protein